MQFSSSDVTSIIAFVSTFVVPIASLVLSLTRPKKKDIKALQKVDEDQQVLVDAQRKEIDRLHKARIFDAGRMVELHNVIRFGSPVLRAQLDDVKQIMLRIEKGGELKNE